jgi:ABC-type glutathione transport system ATPase component
MRNPPIIRVRDLELTYRSRQAVHHALRGVSFHVDKGGF